MLHKTRGVVLGFIKYRETSIIVKIYTEAFGLQSYIVNGVRSKTSKNKIALFQPLTLLDMVVYHKDNKDLHRISELKCIHSFQSIPFNQKKICMVIFLGELLGKTLREHFENQELFDLILNTVSYLDEKEVHFENMHLQFMIQLASILGFSPSTPEEITSEIQVSLTIAEREALIALMKSSPDQRVVLQNDVRRKLLDCLVRYYALHIEGFGQLNSLHVLQSLFE